MTSIALVICGVAGTWLLTAADACMPRLPRRWTAALAMSLEARRASPRRLLLGTLGATAAALTGWTAAWMLFGGLVAPALVAGCSAAVPARASVARRRRRVDNSRQAWPRMLAEIRIGVTHRNQSIPAALFAAGSHAPEEMRAAFEDAARAWALSTDFESSLRVLKTSLADPTADAICETLLAAHQIGGVRLDVRLRALAEAAHAEAAARSDARAKQAGARFARSFVALVPAFMAVIGLSIGRGREAYQAPGGQWLVALSVLAVIGCWLWAGRIMAIPLRKRVFLQ